MSPIYFAIGDIHGEADKLRALHAAILDRIAFEKSPAVIPASPYFPRKRGKMFRDTHTAHQ